MVSKLKLLSIGLLALMFLVPAARASAAVVLSCIDNGSGTTCDASPGLPGNMMATAYAGTYPDTSSNLSWTGTWSPWARCSGSGCSFSSFNISDNSNTWCNHDCGSLGTFWIRFAGNGSYPLDTSTAPGDGEYIFQYSGGNPSLLVASTSGSRITSTTPGDGDMIATSTSFTFGVSGYVAPEDYIPGSTYVKIDFSNGGFESTQLVGPVFSQIQQTDSRGSFTFPVTGSGSFSFSTTTSLLTIGNYDIEARISKPRFTVLGFNFLTSDVAYVHNYFVVSTTTAYGTLRTNAQREFDDFAGTASSTITTSVCNPLSGNFSIIPCTSLLFIPSSAGLTKSVNILHDTILAKWPWGYVTRLAVILTDSTASTSLPSYTAKVDLRGGGDASADLEDISIDPQDMLVGGAALVASIQDTHGYGVTFRDVGEPIAKLVIALFIISIIWHDLLAMAHHRRRPDNQ